MTLWRVQHFCPSLTLTPNWKISFVLQFSRVLLANISGNNSRYEKVARRGSKGGYEEIFHSMTFRWRASKSTRTETRAGGKEGEGRRLCLVLIPGRLLHIHKFCTECQPVVMLRPWGRPGRLLAYFDDISAGAVSPPLPLLLLLTETFLRLSVSRAFALSALITTRFVPLSTARPRLHHSKRNCFETSMMLISSCNILLSTVFPSLRNYF